MKTRRTWEDVQTYLTDREATLADDAAELVWPIEGWPVVERVRPVHTRGRDWLVVSAGVVDSYCAMHDALAYTSTIAIGALAIEEGELVVRHVVAMPIEDDALDEILEVVAFEAAFLRLGRGVTHNPFSYLAD